MLILRELILGRFNRSTSPGSEFCPNRSLREVIWNADVTRCSIYQEKSVQTSVVLEELRDRRIKQAQRLGYQHFAEMSMETKMVGNLDKLYDTLEILRTTGNCCNLLIKFIRPE